MHLAQLALALDKFVLLVYHSCVLAVRTYDIHAAVPILFLLLLHALVNHGIAGLILGDFVALKIYILRVRRTHPLKLRVQRSGPAGPAPCVAVHVQGHVFELPEGGVHVPVHEVVGRLRRLHLLVAQAHQGVDRLNFGGGLHDALQRKIDEMHLLAAA